MTLNSSKLIIPSPSQSTPLIIFLHSAIEHSSPRLPRTFCSSSAEIDPFLSMSKTENASLRFSSTSSESMSLVLSSMNSSRSMKPSPSASTSRTMASSSSGVAGWPRLPMMAPSSAAEILPSPFTSNFLKTCSSSSSIRARELRDDALEGTAGVVEPAVWRRFFFRQSMMTDDYEAHNISMKKRLTKLKC
ncbi:hypothetical protein RJ639_001212 [Escallonia herrerae]|uniref:Uncharacterized protein n=1 Tax=Escallonia herrerae TaxID=1293975 RepID=A0AA89BNF1_9ASTE|nr:hypothetical protein RJ639_001212 [Escallonia herrerae]